MDECTHSNDKNDKKDIKKMKKRTSTIISQPDDTMTEDVEYMRKTDIKTDSNSFLEKAIKKTASKGRRGSFMGSGNSEVEEEEDESEPKKILGKQLTQDHQQYSLSYGMMLGIRTMTGRQDVCQSLCQNGQLKQEVVESDFKFKIELKFPPEGSLGPDWPTPRHKLDRSFKFKDYMPNAFRGIRKLSGIKEGEYLKSVAGDFNYIEFIANSKSGQFFFYSHDGKYMIKTLTKEESKLLVKIMPDYIEHLNNYPNSLLVRFCGMHRVKMNFNALSSSSAPPNYFVIMTSVFDTTKTIHSIYDLKGSTLGRITPPEDCIEGCVMKDLNMKNSDRQISLDLDIVGELANTLQADSSLLARLGIMDYSLLIGIHEKHSVKQGRRMSGVTAPISTSLLVNSAERVDANTYRPSIFKSYCGGIRSSKGTNEIYFLGIIDILQFYNIKKHGETIFKGLTQDKRELSSVNPYFYASRFLRFILKFTDYDEYEKKDKSRYKLTETWI